jgi:trimethylamine--corrinoid protein Co-methyltransferase
MTDTASESPRRRARPDRRARSGPAAPAYVRRAIPFYEFLGEEGLNRIEDQADWLIQEIGIEFREDPVARPYSHGLGLRRCQ